MKRKPIQITSNTDGDGLEALFILCDDGSMWWTCAPYNGCDAWERIADVPQDADPSPLTGRR